MFLTHKQMARTFNRIMDPIEAHINEASYWDAGFDGGEFSSSAWDEVSRKEYDRVLQLCADKFGVTVDQLQEYVDTYYHESYRRWWEAVIDDDPRAFNSY